MNRRVFLTGMAGACVGGSGCAERQPVPGDETDTAPWVERANQAIQTHRTTDLNVQVRDTNDNPVPDADVSVAMQTHDFRFGTAVNAARLLQDKESDDPYRGRLLELFNTAVLEIRHKWKPWEDPSQRAMADEATQWLRDHGFTVRGHTAIWQNLDLNVVPDDVVAKTNSDDPDRSEYLRNRTTNHVRDIVGHYAGQLADWEVLNEHLDYNRITQAIASDSPPQQSPPVAEWFRAANAVAPEADLYVNDYDLISGDREDRWETLETLVTYLQRTDAPIDGIGMQGHFGSPEEAVDPEEFRALLDRYAASDVMLQVTEYDTFGDGWSEQAEADHLEVVLRTLYSHPAAVGFLMWGFWDGQHWQDNAPLFRTDWSKKPAYDVYTDLVFDEWWTDETGTTDESGRFRTRAFLGEYEITVTQGSDTKTVTTSVTDPTSETTVTIAV